MGNLGKEESVGKENINKKSDVELKHQKKHKIIAICLVVLLVVIVILAGVSIYISNNRRQNNSVKASTADNINSIKIANNIEEIKGIEFKLGDVDFDGNITATDALKVLQHATEKIILNEDQLKLADVDGDDKVTKLDSEIILMRATGKISAFPIEDKTIKLYTYGDMNADGEITAYDALMILQATENKLILTEIQQKAADVDSDGKVTDMDSEIVLMRSTGKISAFPVEDSSVVTYILGDVDDNGKIEAYDALLVEQYLENKVQLKGLQKKAADVDGDNSITKEDAKLILRYATGSVQKPTQPVIPEKVEEVKKKEEFPAEVKPIVLKVGDIDNNGKIEAYDALLVLQFAELKITFEANQKKAADVDGDNVVTKLDSEIILMRATGKISVFPIEDSSMVIYTLGDVDSDGKISAFDSLKALQYATGKIQLTEVQKKAADVNIDGKVTEVDAQLILQHATGKITKF